MLPVRGRTNNMASQYGWLSMRSDACHDQYEKGPNASTEYMEKQHKRYRKSNSCEFNGKTVKAY